MGTFGYFWPAIKNERDADSVTRRGAWVCFIVAVLTMLTSKIPGRPVFGILEPIFLVVAALGVRAKSRIAAIAAFSGVLMNSTIAYSSAASHRSLIGTAVILALLLANIRATWLFGRWARDLDTEPVSIIYQRGLDYTLMHQVPVFIWPKVRVPFYVLAAILLIAKALSLLAEFTA